MVILNGRHSDSAVMDKIGDINSGALDWTIMSRLSTGYQHVHRPAQVYPSMSAGVDVTSGAAWTLGAFAEIVPAGGISTHFDIHWVYVEALDTNGTYELVLYKGASGSEEEIGRCRFSRIQQGDRHFDIPIQVPVLGPNDRISAALACSTASATATLSLYYHDYVL